MIQHNGYYRNLIDAPQIKSIFTTRHVELPAALEEQGIAADSVAHMHQVHAARVAVVDNAPIAPIPNTDAMVTASTGVYLAVKTADCLPILIAHNSKPVIAAIHAGRKSTELGIVGATINMIRQTFHCSDDYTVWFGPRICASCYQIDRETNLHYDMVGENTAQLNAIISNPTIIDTNRCTKCEHNDFYSYRCGDRKKRLYSVIGRQPE